MFDSVAVFWVTVGVFSVAALAAATGVWMWWTRWNVGTHRDHQRAERVLDDIQDANQLQMQPNRHSV